MTTAHFTSFYPALCAGFGLFLVGAVNLVLLRRGAAVRVVATLFVAAVAVAAAAAIGLPGTVAATAGLLGVGLAAVLVGSDPRVVAAAAACTRPVARYGLLAAVGVTTAVGSLVAFDRADREAVDASTADLFAATDRHPAVVARARALTDCGSVVTLREPAAIEDARSPTEGEQRYLATTRLGDQVIRRGVAGPQANCHGWVFTGGQFRLSGDDVGTVLAENGYRVVESPAPDDVVVYRNNDAVTHTGVVRYVTAGEPVLIESKWGDLGVYLHAADRSPYGTEYTFHRSARRGHLLVGLSGTVR